MPPYLVTGGRMNPYGITGGPYAILDSATSLSERFDFIVVGLNDVPSGSYAILDSATSFVSERVDFLACGSEGRVYNTKLS